MKREIFPQKITISWVKNLYRQNKLSPEELIQEIILRSKETKEYHIWIDGPDKQKLSYYLDRLDKIDRNLPLWGIPFAVKDNIDVKGFETTAGCPEFSYRPENDAVVIEKLINAGAIPIGKTNLDQFATGLVGTRSPYGEVLNSLKPELISGGSSSGSAVSVAMGQACFALGTDTAGSGRVPAALNNIIGYKPSVGAWSTKGLVPACASIDCITVFANQMEDIYLVDSLVRGYEEDDIWSKEYEEPTARRPEKILLPMKPLTFFGDYAIQYKKSWERVVRQCDRLGIPIEYMDNQLLEDAASILYDGPWVAERWTDLKEFIECHEEAVLPVTKKILRNACKEEFNSASVFKALHDLQKYKRIVKKKMQDGVLILPTCAGTFTRDQVRENPISTNSDMGRYTNHCNLLDLGAIAIPSGFADVDLPFGITAFSLSDQEDLLKGFAEEYSKLKTVEIAVCGLHMRGFSLEHQLLNLGAEFVRVAQTTSDYRMFRLSLTSPTKPALVKSEHGKSIEVEIWAIPEQMLAEFMKFVAPPLSIGRIYLEDGSFALGFVGEAADELRGDDISTFGGWRYAQNMV